jgi:dTDP-4-dehydrorhamnose reductase
MDEKVKKKILILGSTGMLGHVVFTYLNSEVEFEVHDIAYRTKLRNETIVCDITNVEEVTKQIKQLKPDYIINCIGILIKGSEVNPANAIFINSYFPHLLVQIADEINSKVIHISTDCVFTGKKGSYTESDFRDADDTYGRSKALGELFTSPHLTLRTSIIGPEIKKDGEGLFHWFMNQNGQINGFTSAFWSGVTTLQLAKNIKQSINVNCTGLFHVTNGESISKYDLVNLIKQIWKKHSVSILPYSGKPVDKSLVSIREIDFKVPSYADMLLSQYEWMKGFKEMYSSFYSSI